jgi:hypothetical protein
MTEGGKFHKRQFFHINGIQPNPTTKYQKSIRNKINNNTKKKKKKKNLINLNPQLQILQALVKSHKPNNSISPIINWHNAPMYNLAKHLTKLLTEAILFPNSFNIRKTNTLTEDFYNIKINENICLCSSNIKKYIY